MKTSGRVAVVFASVITSFAMLSPSISAQAKGSFDKIVVFAGVSGSFEVDEPSLLGFFSFSDFSERLSWPAAPGEGWLIARYANDQKTGEPVPVDHIWMYPPSGNRGPFVYYQGLVNGSSEYDGKLFEGNPEALRQLQSIVEASSQPAPSTSQIAPLLVIGLLGICLGIGVSQLLLRRRSGRTKASA